MRKKNIIIPLFCGLLAGSIAGYGIAYLQYHPPADVENTAPAADTGPDIDPVEEPGPVVTVRFYDNTDHPVRDVVGVLLAGPGSGDALLLTRMTGFQDVDHAEMVTAGRRYPLDSVVALDESAGLVLLATGTPEVRMLTPVRDASLYLGRDVQAITPHEKTHGMVDSPARQFAGQYYSYAVKLDVPFSAGFAALLDPESGVLIGVILDRIEKNERYRATDTASINSLIDNIGSMPAQSVAQFSRQTFLETVRGLLYRIKLAVAQADWGMVAVLSRKLNRDDLTNRSNIAQQLHSAFLQMANAGLETGNYDQALSILDESDRLLGVDPVSIRMRAKVLFEMGVPLQGIAQLSHGIDQGIADEATYTMLQSLVLSQVNNDNLATGTVMDMLNQAIMRDAEFAPYHVQLGRLLYREKHYAEALSSFNYATQLDPALQDELQPLMNSARQRLNMPGQIIVPLQVRGSNIIVDVTVNHTPQRFILDTGASVTVLSTKVANAIGLTTYDAEYTMLNTANGVVRAPLVTVDSVGLDNAVVNNMKVAILDRMGPVDGLLGLDFLNHFDIDIDRAAGEILLRRR